MSEVIKAQLKAIVALSQSALAQLEEQDQVCDHPADERIDMSTMGHERWKCRVCGYFYDPNGGE